MSSVISSSPMLIHRILGLASASLICSQKSQRKKKAKWKISICRWEWCHTSSHSIWTLKKSRNQNNFLDEFKLHSGAGNKIWISTFLTLAVCFLSQHTLVTYSYQCVITFGGCRDDFMVVVSQQREPGVGKKSVEKLLFGMVKPKVRRVHTQ